MARIAIDDAITQKSRLREVQQLCLTEDPTALEIESERPIAATHDPNQIVPHDKITTKVRESIVSIYGSEYFYGREWTLGTLKKLHKAITNPRENLVSAIAQICSPKCDFRDMCVMDIAGRPPLGERCPKELEMAKLFTDEYIESVANHLGLEPSDIRDDLVLFNMVIGVVGTDITSIRLDAKVARDGFIQQDPTAVNQETGQVYYKDEEAVAIRIKDRVRRQRESLIEQLMASPEMQAKLRRPKESSAAKQLAAVVERLANRLLAMETTATVKPEDNG